MGSATLNDMKSIKPRPLLGAVLMLAWGNFLMPVAAVADIALVLQKFDHGTAADKSLVMMLMSANSDGFNAANAELKAAGKSMLYCAPETITLTPEQLIDILRRWVEANRIKSPRLDAAPPTTALLYALEDAFPCPK
jgi:hypothetical protein